MNPIFLEVTIEIINHLKILGLCLHDCIKGPDDGGTESGKPTGPQSNIRVAQEKTDVWIRIAEWKEATVREKQLVKENIKVSSVGVLTQAIDQQVGQKGGDDHFDLKQRKIINQLCSG